MTFKVNKAGPLTTIQDGGRKGQSHLGLTEGGPMDFRSFALANRLVGNDVDTAALEITLGGLIIECMSPATIAVTGAFCPLTINGKSEKLWRSHHVRTGDIIEIGFAALGVRSYLAVNGGIQSEHWFGSQSTVIRENLGRRLKTDDVIATMGKSTHQCLELDYRHQPSLRKKAELEFVAGYQWETIPQAKQNLFTSSTFLVSSRNDRMGYQLEGPKIETGIKRIYSEGIATGSIQVTGEGQPIVLMRDRQTIGGYPKLGAITSASQSTLAQLPRGAELTFVPVTPEKAVQRRQHFLDSIDTATIKPVKSTG